MPQDRSPLIRIYVFSRMNCGKVLSAAPISLAHRQTENSYALARQQLLKWRDVWVTRERKMFELVRRG